VPEGGVSRIPQDPVDPAFFDSRDRTPPPPELPSREPAARPERGRATVAILLATYTMPFSADRLQFEAQTRRADEISS